MFIPDPGSDFFPIPDPGSPIPDPNCLHPGSRIPDPGSRILVKEFKYFNPQKSKKKWFLSSKKYDPGCSSRIPDPDADFLPSRIPDPGSRIQGLKRHPIPDPGSGSATRLLVEHHSCCPHCFPLGRGPPLGCRAEIRTRACRTASRRATIWATPHPNEPLRTLRNGHGLLHCTENSTHIFPELNCVASFTISTFMYLWAICIFPRSVLGRPIVGIYKSHECGNWETEHYNSVLEITRPHRFISWNTSIGTRYLYWILTGPSLACGVTNNAWASNAAFWSYTI